MLKYILAFLVVVIAWVAWFFLKGYFAPPMSVVYPILVSVLVLLVLAAILFARWFRARRAAQQLERALAEQAAQHAKSSRPDVQAEILEMQQEFEKAIAALKSSKAGKGKQALYALPWQIIIGPPGAGKTTALRNSGLQFPYLSARTGGAVRGLGGTRNCDWWLTNEAVILDTAGRWATQEEDRDEWLGFLDLVKKFRSRKPLNGIIAAVSIADLGGASEDEVTALANKIRERIDEAQNRLQMSLPVYVLFTKCDLIPGFVESFGSLSKNDRGQVWGFTVPLEGAGPPGDHFLSRFDQLVTAVDGRVAQRMSEERRIDTREMVYVFPRQLAVLRNNLGSFVAQLFEGNIFRETPIMRGVYFTSGTQEGRPIDRVMHRMAEAFGIQSALPLAAPPTQPKSYFLREVFEEVIFKDADLAVRSAAELGRQRRVQYAVAGVMFALAVALLVLPALSWARNRAELVETQRVVESSAAVLNQPQAAKQPLAPETVEALGTQAKKINSWAPLLNRAGMNQRGTVDDPLQDYYSKALRKRVVEQIFGNLESDLDAFAREYQARPPSERPPVEQYQLNYGRLRSYLLLSVPRDTDQPELDPDLQRQLANYMADRWAAALGIPSTGATGDTMRAHMTKFVESMARNDDYAFPRNVGTVGRVRGVLTRVSTVDFAVDGFVEEFANRGLDITLEQMVGGTRTGLQARRPVAAAFTKNVYDTVIRGRLESGDATQSGEPWVLGAGLQRAENAQAEADRRREAVRQEYYRRYIEEWRNFLRNVYVNPPTDNEQARDLASSLIGDHPSPLEKLWQKTHENVNIAPPPPPEDPAEKGMSIREKLFRRNVCAKLPGDVTVKKMACDAAWMRAKNDPNASVEPEGLSEESVGKAFDGFTRFGVPPAAPQGTPPASTELTSYQEQLLFVRNALQTYLEDSSNADELLKVIQTARTRTLGQIDEQEVGWRPVFKSIIWPPLDGTTMSVTKGLAKGVGRSWCEEVVEPFDRTLWGLYPFAAKGQDVSYEEFSAFYAPDGTLWKFYDEVLKGHAPRKGGRFEFAHKLGRNESTLFEPGLLRFLLRANDITRTFFPPNEKAPRVDFDARIRPSPRVAVQTLSIGGKAVEYHNGPEEWQRFSWPGEDDPAAGAQIEIRGEAGMHEVIRQEGEWGLFHLLEAGTVVASGGRVFTVVWHLRTHDVDVTVDFRPVREDEPFFGITGPGRSRGLLQPVRASDVEPPRSIAIGGRACPRRDGGV